MIIRSRVFVLAIQSPCRGVLNKSRSCFWVLRQNATAVASLHRREKLGTCEGRDCHVPVYSPVSWHGMRMGLIRE